MYFRHLQHTSNRIGRDINLSVSFTFYISLWRVFHQLLLSVLFFVPFVSFLGSKSIVSTKTWNLPKYYSVLNNTGSHTINAIKTAMRWHLLKYLQLRLGNFSKTFVFRLLSFSSFNANESTSSYINRFRFPEVIYARRDCRLRNASGSIERTPLRWNPSKKRL